MSVLGFMSRRRPTISTPRRERHRSRRPLLESLEDRALLASTITEFPLSSGAHASAAALLGRAAPIHAAAESTAQLNLSITANTSTVVAGGGTVTYKITVTNPGSDPATDVQVVDKIPAGFSFVSGDPTFGSHVEGNSVVNDLGTVDPGATLVVRIRLRADASAIHRTSGGKIKNVVTATSSTADDATVSISTSVAGNLMPNNQVGKDVQSAVTAAVPKSLGNNVLKLNLVSASLASLTAERATKTITGVVNVSYMIPQLFKLPGTIRFSTTYINPTSNKVKVDVNIGDFFGEFLTAADKSKVASAVRAAVLAVVKKDAALITKALA